jgi:hypothetical protein
MVGTLLVSRFGVCINQDTLQAAFRVMDLTKIEISHEPSNEGLDNCQQPLLDDTIVAHTAQRKTLRK